MKCIYYELFKDFTSMRGNNDIEFVKLSRVLSWNPYNTEIADIFLRTLAEIKLMKNKQPQNYLDKIIFQKNV